MENAARVIITVFFIGLIALAIIFFGVFGILPLARIGKRPGNSSSTVVVINEQTGQPAQQPSPTSSPNEAPATQQTPPAGQTSQPESSGPPPVETPPTPPPPKVVRLDVPPGSPDAPQQSNPIAQSDVPKGALDVVVNNGTFAPSSFAVKAGAQITIYFTSADGRTHSIGFEDPSVQGIAVGVGPGETRSVTFTAPKAGTYAFECNVPGHAAGGEQGTMVVQ